jgi:hypothetical protein
MFIKLISILCVATIILGIIAISIYMMRQQKKRYTPGLQEFAQQLNFIHHESEAEIRSISEQFTHLDFFRHGHRPRIRALIQGSYENSVVQIMIVTLTRSGVDQGFTDEYTAVCINQARLNLPHFKLQPKGYALERAINAITLGKAPQVSLAEYPALAKQYQLTSPQPDVTHHLFTQGIGSYLNNLIAQSQNRSLEGQGNQFFYYTYLKNDLQIDALHHLYEESKQVLNLLEQATIS